MICHLLANGQRVLVTSHTARALEVLKDKIPEQVSHLCVGLLGDDRLALKDLEDSVSGITTRYGKWNHLTSNNRISTLEQSLEANRSLAVKLIAALQDYRERETRSFAVVDGYFGTATTIANQVNMESEDLGWLADSPLESVPPPLSNQEFGELIGLIGQISPQQKVEAELRRLDTDELPNPSTFSQMIHLERTAQDQVDQSAIAKNESTITGCSVLRSR